jgi:hypothetical protein
MWLALASALNVSISACVAKPPFHCQSDDACVTADGSRGSCDASGECSFRAALGNPGAAGASDAGAGDASCTDQDAGSCYACSPKTQAQFLNACTSAACVPFDDQARLTKLTVSGELPPLPPASGQ